MPGRPWVCLLCPLAAFAPRHLPNLLRLKGYFSRQARGMTTAQFLRIFGPYAARLDEDILPRFGPAAITAAAHQIADAAAELPLHLEEQPLWKLPMPVSRPLPLPDGIPSTASRSSRPPVCGGRPAAPAPSSTRTYGT